MKTGFYPYPLRGGRRLSTKVFLLSGYISIHALREEGDNGLSEPGKPLMQFLSTPSARRATICPLLGPHRRPISIHALREEGDDGKLCLTLPRGISIHALREEGDVCGGKLGLLNREFLSTPSARRATRGSRHVRCKEQISIHALREEGDRLLRQLHRLAADFYPRPP